MAELHFFSELHLWLCIVPTQIKIAWATHPCEMFRCSSSSNIRFWVTKARTTPGTSSGLWLPNCYPSPFISSSATSRRQKPFQRRVSSSELVFLSFQGARDGTWQMYGPHREMWMDQLQTELPTGTTPPWHSGDSWKQRGVGCGAENQFPGSYQQLGSRPLTYGQETRVKVLFPGSPGLPYTHANLLAQCVPYPEPSAPTILYVATILEWWLDLAILASEWAYCPRTGWA